MQTNMIDMVLTPWGVAQTMERVAEGITRYDTSSHGGYRLTPERVAAMPADIRAIKPYAADGWYEEDEDWALVCLAFPECFPPDAFHFAVMTQQHSHPELITPERKAKAGGWLSDNGDKWARGSEGTSGKDWFVNAYSLADPSKRMSKVFPGIPLLPSIFTVEQFEQAEIYKG